VYECFACIPPRLTPYACLVTVKVRRHRISVAVELQMVVSLLVSSEYTESLLVPSKSNKCSLRHLSTTPSPNTHTHTHTHTHRALLCKQLYNKQKQKDPAIIRHNFSQDLRFLYSPGLEAHAFNPQCWEAEQMLVDLSPQPGLHSSRTARAT
jgi:hypothetical protein